MGLDCSTLWRVRLHGSRLRQEDWSPQSWEGCSECRTLRASGARFVFRWVLSCAEMGGR